MAARSDFNGAGMTPATRARLGLVPLPPEQAARVEAQQRLLATGQCLRWPAGLHHLELAPAGISRTPLPEAVELDPDSGWAQWDLAVRLGDRA